MTTRFVALAIALAFCFFITLPIYAQGSSSPEKKALIKELLELMNASNTSEAIANQFLDQLQEPMLTLISQGLQLESPNRKWGPAEERRLKAQTDEAAKRILVRMRVEFPKRISYGEIVSQVGLEIYDKHFTEAEVKDLIAFYKTATAQKFIRLLPQITAEMLPRIGELIEPKLTGLISEFIADERKKLGTKQN